MKTSFGIPHGGNNFVYPYVNSVMGLCLTEAAKPYQIVKAYIEEQIKNVTDESLKAELIKLIQTAEESRKLGSILPHGSCYVDDNRNGIGINFCIKTSDEWLLMVDPDIEFPIDILDLHEKHVRENPEAKIIAGRVNLLNGLPVFYFATSEGNKHYCYPFKGLKEFDRIGTGIIFIHKDVFVKLREDYNHPHFFSRVLVNGLLYGDDFSFCLRARKAGFKLYGAWDIVGIHNKIYPVPQVYPEAQQVEIKVK